MVCLSTQLLLLLFVTMATQFVKSHIDLEIPCDEEEYLSERREKDPNFAAKEEEYERLLLKYKEYVGAQDETTRRLQTTNSNPFIIGVVFHILWNSDEPGQEISMRQLESQIYATNEDLRRFNIEFRSGSNTGLWSDRDNYDTRIQLAIYDVIWKEMGSGWDCGGNAATTSTFLRNLAMKTDISFLGTDGSAAVEPTKFLNVWVCDTRGYATFPEDHGTWFDGIVLPTWAIGDSYYDTDNSFYFPSSCFDQGNYLTHEVGHYFNLRHIWGDSNDCNAANDDGVEDTPHQLTSSSSSLFSCSFTNSCPNIDPLTGNNLRDMHENFMDYGCDHCIYMFTEDQALRMWVTLIRFNFLFINYRGPRRSLVEYYTPPEECDGFSFPHDYCFPWDAGNCEIYHMPPGCDLCESDNFKLSYNHPCVDCQDTFGDACLHCGDFDGCQQCHSNIYQRTYDAGDDIWYCKPTPCYYMSNHCAVCNNGQCSQCENGYTMMTNGQCVRNEWANIFPVGP